MKKVICACFGLIFGVIAVEAAECTQKIEDVFATSGKNKHHRSSPLNPTGCTLEVKSTLKMPFEIPNERIMHPALFQAIKGMQSLLTISDDGSVSMDSRMVKDISIISNTLQLLKNKRLQDSLLSSISKLHLEKCLVGPNDAIMLSKAITCTFDSDGRLMRGNNSLSELWIAGNNLGDKGTEALAKALTRTGSNGLMFGNTSLKRLEIGNNNIGRRGIVAIATMLQSNATLELLGIDNNPGVALAQDELSKALVKSKLTYLDLGDNNTSPSILSSLKNNESLQWLEFYKNDVSTLENARVLGDMLSVNHTLKKLHLGRCQINDEGIRIICEALKVTNTLEYLNISTNEITAVGVEYISGMLKFNQSLKALRMCSTKINNAGATKIAEALKTNSTLAALDLTGNHIANLGAKEIISALKSNTALLELIMDGNPIFQDKSFKEVLDDVLDVNTTLGRLILPSFSLTRRVK